ncbi:LOW QUALITY PROTEIN: uncharacterized protein C8orf86 homolog [Otolemur garnettii]|uniref:LOW QUALITY PROTEIN: uncharacterized protein C8orf86 homolog n=1 Tax=Otolemur garnettii TaxID=30611 RepID=UPI00064410FD|nr:LOW QUALITY PROTEIN: uncharacterized protein C8orf86 homolog [Otolemur garnettii]
MGKDLLTAEGFIRNRIRVGEGLGDCLGQRKKPAEELGNKRPKPAKWGTEGKEEVEQEEKRQRTGCSKEPRMQIICRRH